MASLVIEKAKRLCSRSVLVACLILLAVSSVRADRFYTDSDKPGYWWYKDPVEEAQKEPEKKTSEPKKPEVPVAERPQEHKLLKLSDYPVEVLWKMHPDDYQKLMDDFRKQSVQTLSEEDIHAYYYLQDIARRKALAYTNVQQVVMQKDPNISMEPDMPTSAPGKIARTSELASEEDALLRSAKGRYGLIFFYSKNCSYCTEQKKILNFFLKTHKWELKEIDIDKNPSLVSVFNITTTPTIIAAKKNTKDFIPVGYGVVSLDIIKSRLYGGIRLLDGDISVQEYNMKGKQKGGAFDVNAPLRGQR